MANDTTVNPWKIDTASGTAITTDLVRVRGVRWVGATTAAHTAVIQNAAGKVMWTSVANAANYVEADGLGMTGMNMQGMIVPTLASGILYIELA